MIRKTIVLGVCLVFSALLATCAAPSAPTQSSEEESAETMSAVLTEISDQIRQSQTSAPSPTDTEKPTPAATDTPTEIPTVDLGAATPELITPVGSPAGPTPTTDPESLKTRTLVGKCNAAFFVGDIGPIQDGTTVKPNAQFTKTWEIRNIGFCTWDQRYQLFYYGASADSQHMSGPDFVGFPEVVAPNQSTWLSVTLIAPDSPGIHKSTWYLRDPDGKRFGVGIDGNEPLLVIINVE
ncbi:MAG: hypothetical protein JW929_02195 [Anaerolineales bacterium]|nr:hypothetical protein [Anaerolineales bacterium]